MMWTYGHRMPLQTQTQTLTRNRTRRHDINANQQVSPKYQHLLTTSLSLSLSLFHSFICNTGNKIKIQRISDARNRHGKQPIHNSSHPFHTTSAIALNSAENGNPLAHTHTHTHTHAHSLNSHFKLATTILSHV